NDAPRLARQELQMLPAFDGFERRKWIAPAELLRAFTPRTGRQVLAEKMLAVGRARVQRVFGFFQRHLPLVCARTCGRIAKARDETADEKLAQRRRQQPQRRRSRHRAIRYVSASAVREMPG